MMLINWKNVIVTFRNCFNAPRHNKHTTAPYHEQRNVSNKQLGNKNHQSTKCEAIESAIQANKSEWKENKKEWKKKKKQCKNEKWQQWECEYKHSRIERQRKWEGVQEREEKSSVYFHLKDFINSINRSRAIHACRFDFFILFCRFLDCFVFCSFLFIRFLSIFSCCYFFFSFALLFIPYHKLHFPYLSKKKKSQTLFELLDKCE